jgi:hypothetical protein
MIRKPLHYGRKTVQQRMLPPMIDGKNVPAGTRNGLRTGIVLAGSRSSPRLPRGVTTCRGSSGVPCAVLCAGAGLLIDGGPLPP